MTTDLNMVANLLLLWIGFKMLSITKGFLPRLIVSFWFVFILAAQIADATLYKDFLLLMPILIGATLFLGFIHSNKKTRKEY